MTEPTDHTNNTQPKYHCEQAITFLPKVLTTLLAILTIVSLVMYIAIGIEAAMVLVIVLGFSVVIGLLLSKIKIKVGSGVLTIRFGPLKTVLRISEIKSIESVTINPLSVYRGYGKRFGKDGSIGYIASGKKGIRVKMNGGKVFVITCDNPHDLLVVVKKYQDNFSH